MPTVGLAFADLATPGPTDQLDAQQRGEQGEQRRCPHGERPLDRGGLGEDLLGSAARPPEPVDLVGRLRQPSCLVQVDLLGHADRGMGAGQPRRQRVPGPPAGRRQRQQRHERRDSQPRSGLERDGFTTRPSRRDRTEWTRIDAVVAASALTHRDLHGTGRQARQEVQQYAVGTQPATVRSSHDRGGQQEPQPQQEPLGAAVETEERDERIVAADHECAARRSEERCCPQVDPREQPQGTI